MTHYGREHEAAAAGTIFGRARVEAEISGREITPALEALLADEAGAAFKAKIDDLMAAGTPGNCAKAFGDAAMAEFMADLRTRANLVPR